MSDSEIHKYGTDDGWHGKIEEGGQFPPEKDRYHLYIGLFCPFAHRVNLVRHLKHLTDILPISIVRPYPKDGGGWRFPATSNEYPNATVDHLFNSKFLSEVYFKDDKDYKGKYSVPLLWDKKAGRIVNNESAEMLHWLPAAFNSLLPPEIASIDIYPSALRPQIDTIAAWLKSHINSGVYKAGFARTQESYDTNMLPLFAALNALEALVASHGGPYILGPHLTELDLLAYPTLARFDAVYVQHFKTNLGTVRHEYPVLNAYLRGLYWGKDGQACWRDTTDWKHIKENYTKSHAEVNPLAITPLGPWPEVEEGVVEDWGSLKVGSVGHPGVLEVAKTLGI